MFKNFQNYEEPFPAGLILPQIKIDEKYYKELSLDSEISNFDFLKALCRKGIFDLGINRKENKKEYYDRALFELEVIEELSFTDYILLNWDVLNFCREKDIPTGFGRGSAASSLVLFLTGVTRIDPIEHGLFFERFISKFRARKFIKDGIEYLDGSLAPDIDNDISYDRRQEVISYIEEKHKGKTAKILTLNTLSGKLCMKECGKIVDGLNEMQTNQISDSIPKTFGKVCKLSEAPNESETFAEFSTQYSNSFLIAKKLEGLIKNQGVHPSGIAISFQGIDGIMPLQLTGDEATVSSYDMNDVAETCVKFDILGLRTLSVVQDVCKSIGVAMDGIDPNDESIYIAMQNLVSPKGIFQIEAPTNFQVCKKIAPKNLEELSAVVAIARPAALSFVNDYAKYAHTGEFQSAHPFFDEILKYTGGIPLYQEQLMKMVVKVGFTAEEAEKVRRIVGKKKVEEMSEWQEKIKSKIQENNLDPKIEEVLWKFAEDSANYSFNKCLDPSTLVETKSGKKTMREVKVGEFIRAYCVDTGYDELVEVKDKIWGEKKIFKVTTKLGKEIKCSKSHKFLCEDLTMRPMSQIRSENLSIISGENGGNLDSILTIEDLGIQKTLDFTVNSKDHNFYAEGLVTSNSHSFSYATLAAITAYLKFNYPQQFFLSLLKFTQFEPAPHEEIALISQELDNFGIKLLPPDLNYSDSEFKIEGDDIRYGLTAIKGVASKSLENLLSFRENKFDNKYDVFIAAKESKVGIGILSALIQAGMLDSFVTSNRSRLVLEAQTFNSLTDREKRNFIEVAEKYNYDILATIADFHNNDLLGDNNKPMFTEKRWITFSKKYEKYKEIYQLNKKSIKYANWFFEDSLLGYSYSHDIRELFVNSKHLKNTREIKAADDRNEVNFVGVVTDAVKRISQKTGNEYLRLLMRDNVGEISVLFSNSDKSSKLSKFIEENDTPKKGDVLIINGSKAPDIVFANDITVSDQKIYMKLSQLK